MRPPSPNPKRAGRPQSFLRSRHAHTLDHRKIASLTADEAFEQFKAIRFADNNGEPYCPECGGVAYNSFKRWNKARTVPRTIFKCKECDWQYTLTSGTPLAYRKMSFHDILYAIALFIQFPKGLAALQLQSILGCNYGTAKLITRKFREGMDHDLGTKPLGGHVEADNCEIGGYRRPLNARKTKPKDGADKSRKTGYKLDRDSKRKLFVTVVRERGPHGCIRTGITRTKGESRSIVEANVSAKTILFTDDGGEYSGLLWDVANHFTVVHKQTFYTDEANTNLAENYFSMLRRSETGTYHSVSDPDHAHSYAQEQAWRLTHKGRSNGDKFGRLARTMVRRGRSQHAGLFQRNRRAA